MIVVAAQLDFADQATRDDVVSVSAPIQKATRDDEPGCHAYCFAADPCHPAFTECLGDIPAAAVSDPAVTPTTTAPVVSSGKVATEQGSATPKKSDGLPSTGGGAAGAVWGVLLLVVGAATVALGRRRRYWGKS